MIAYIDGLIKEKTPTYVILDNHGIGYRINISLNTYTKINNLERTKLHTYLSIREDAHTLYGFAEEVERKLFLHLISVSGVGNNTAMLILSSLNTDELVQAITTGNVTLLQSIKGIGQKTAQRLIIDLKDKLGKDTLGVDVSFNSNLDNNIRKEAMSALISLGFSKNAVEKTIDTILRQNSNLQSVEDLIKYALKHL
jgi:Holliday junction DNA helicase RuvA